MYFAQTLIEDIFDGTGDDDKLFHVGQRITDGAMMPEVKEERPAFYTYIDDYGIVGVGSVTVDDKTHPARAAGDEAKQLLQAASFDVHKEVSGDTVRMVGADVQVTKVRPNQDKMWLAAEAAMELARRKGPVPVAVVDSAVGIFTWGS